MRLILSDCSIPIGACTNDTCFIDLSTRKIAPCTGCFRCWVKTPGKCVIRDDAIQIYPLIAQSDTLLYISKIEYGSYDVPMKTMLERAIPIQQAFIRMYHGETHHLQRDVIPKHAVILAYGDDTPDGQSLFKKLVVRNAYNMNFDRWQVRFCTQESLPQIIAAEVASWNSF